MRSTVAEITQVSENAVVRVGGWSPQVSGTGTSTGYRMRASLEQLYCSGSPNQPHPKPWKRAYD